jgi:hypothetical protein
MANSDDAPLLPEQPGDKFRTVLDFADRETAARFVRDHDLDLILQEPVGGGPRVRLTYLLTLLEIEMLRGEGIKPEVHENASAIGRLRQGDVGQGDRFQGGRRVPHSRNLSPREQ